jgi:hypothetical protein
MCETCGSRDLSSPHPAPKLSSAARALFVVLVFLVVLLAVVLFYRTLNTTMDLYGRTYSRMAGDAAQP